MGFYEAISKYYDYIFPVGNEQLSFLKKELGAAPKRVLDIACGSGGYSVELAREGHLVTSVDLDNEMINMLKEKAKREDLDINAGVCDMKALKSYLCKTGFQLVFCIGNSIVHLDKHEDIRDALNQMYSVTAPGGTIILQIINFDRVMKHNITELPTLINSEAGVKFSRKYEFSKETGHIKFKTVLEVKNENNEEHLENSIDLLPISSNTLINLLKEAGFNTIKSYGDFSYSEFNEDAFLLVIKAQKL